LTEQEPRGGGIGVTPARKCWVTSPTMREPRRGGTPRSGHKPASGSVPMEAENCPLHDLRTAIPINSNRPPSNSGPDPMNARAGKCRPKRFTYASLKGPHNKKTADKIYPK